jgi:hypothetical protein
MQYQLDTFSEELDDVILHMEQDRNFTSLALKDARYTQRSLRIRVDTIHGLQIIQSAILAAHTGHTTQAVLSDQVLRDLSYDRSTLHGQRLDTDRAHLITTVTHVDDEYVFATTIPIKDETKTFDLYKVIPIPFRTEKDFLIPKIESAYYGFNKHDMAFVTFTQPEFEICDTRRDCKSSVPAQHISQDCVSNQFRHAHKKVDCTYKVFPDTHNFFHTVGNATVCYFPKKTPTHRVCTAASHEVSSTSPTIRVGGSILYTPSACYWEADGARITPVNTVYTITEEGKYDPLPPRPPGSGELMVPIVDTPIGSRILGRLPIGDPVDTFLAGFRGNPIGSASTFAVPLAFAAAAALGYLLHMCCARKTTRNKKDCCDGPATNGLTPSFIHYESAKSMTPPRPPKSPYITRQQVTKRRSFFDWADSIVRANSTSTRSRSPPALPTAPPPVGPKMHKTTAIIEMDEQTRQQQQHIWQQQQQQPPPYVSARDV